MELKKAIEVLVSELTKDEAYRYGWQSNIAMAFFDACGQEGIQLPQLHDVSNKAANQFLRNLCRGVEIMSRMRASDKDLMVSHEISTDWEFAIRANRKNENMDAEYPEILNEAITNACKEKTLIDALTSIAVWENYKTKVTLSSDGTCGFVWDTCFKVCFEAVTLKWQEKHNRCSEISIMRCFDRNSSCLFKGTKE